MSVILAILIFLCGAMSVVVVHYVLRFYWDLPVEHYTWPPAGHVECPSCGLYVSKEDLDDEFAPYCSLECKEDDEYTLVHTQHRRPE